jgi:hypothetical protein
MRLVLLGIMTLLASIALEHAAQAQGAPEDEPGYAQAPVGHRQPTQSDVEGDDQVEETGLAKEIDKENRLLDRELQGICRGC